jgi:hypothetical protein
MKMVNLKKMKLSPSVPSFNFGNSLFKENDLSNKNSLNGFLPETQLPSIYTNKKEENSEIQLYKNLISSSEYQINNLQKILEIKKLNFNKLISKFPKFENERIKHNERIDSLNKKYISIYKNLENEKEYYKKEYQYKKNNMILKIESKKIYDKLSFDLEQSSFQILDKLIYLKKLLNECSKYMSISTSSQYNSHKNNKNLNQHKKSLTSEKKKNIY